MDRRRNGAARRRQTSLNMKSCHWKVSHAHTRADAWTTSCRRGAARDNTCITVSRRGFHRHVDRPRAPRNLRFPVGEELAKNSPAAATTTARRSDGGGFREDNKVTEMKNDHRKSELGFPFGFDTM